MLIINWQVLLIILLIIAASKKNGLELWFSDTKDWRIKISFENIYLFPFVKKQGLKGGYQLISISPEEHDQARFWILRRSIHFLIFQFDILIHERNKAIHSIYNRNYNWKEDPSWHVKLDTLRKTDYFDE